MPLGNFGFGCAVRANFPLERAHFRCCQWCSWGCHFGETILVGGASLGLTGLTDKILAQAGTWKYLFGLLHI